MDNQCIQHRVSYITLTLTHVVSMLRNFPLGSSRITWSQCYETSYLDAFAIALCCGKSEHRGVVGGEGEEHSMADQCPMWTLHEDHTERRVMLFSSFSFFFPLSTV